MTHAISSTTPTAANNSTSAGRDEPTTVSCADSLVRLRPACVFGSAASIRLPMRSRSALAAAKLTPGFSRPTLSSCPPAARSPCGVG